MLPEGQRPLARELQSAVLGAEPRLTQTVKWGNLVFMLAGTNLLAIVPHKLHVNLQLFNGAEIAAQWPQLEGSGKGLRHLKCRYGAPLDVPLVGALVRDAVTEAEA
jgi:hypothetical protein